MSGFLDDEGTNDAPENRADLRWVNLNRGKPCFTKLPSNCLVEAWHG